MKLLSILSILLVINSIVFGQIRIKFKIASIKYNIEGTIFDRNDYNNGYPDFADPINRFTPGFSQVQTAENLLLNNLSFVKYIGLTGAFKKENLRSKLCTYKRQYVGFIDSAKDSIIIIHALDFKMKNTANREFKGWERDYVMAYDGFYSTAIITFSINLTKKIVSLY